RSFPRRHRRSRALSVARRTRMCVSPFVSLPCSAWPRSGAPIGLRVEPDGRILRSCSDRSRPSFTGELAWLCPAAESEIMTMSNPPAVPHALLLLLLPANGRETVSGDLLEEYAEARVPALGRLRADLWYWRQVGGLWCRAYWWLV